MPALEPLPSGYYVWHYVPSLALSIVFGVLFAICTLATAWKMFRTRAWFTIPMVIGGLLEVIGYVARGIATHNTGSLLPYIMQAIFLLLPPVFFAATLYMTYSRILRAVHGESCSLISPKWTTRIFVVGDIISLMVQCSGSGLTATQQDNTSLGDNIIVGGLFVQIVSFLGFIACCWVFHARFRAYLIMTGHATMVPWHTALWMLYGTSVLIMVRSVFRVVEFIMGIQQGYFANNEWPFYVFDGALMVLVMAGFFIWYPSQLRPSDVEPIDVTYHEMSRAAGDCADASDIRK